MKSVSGIQKKHILVAFVFMVYMAEYMISLICMDRSSYGPADAGELLHYLKMPALAIGILLFPLSQKLGSSIKARRIIMLVSNIIFVAGMACVMEIFFKTGPALNIISCLISLLSLGFIGGAVYYFFAMAFAAHPYTGRISGLAGAAAFLIQMLVLYIVPANLAMLILLMAGFLITAYITIISEKRFEWMFDEPLEYARKGDTSLPDVRSVFFGMVGMTIVYMICGFTDTIIISMSFSGDMSIYAWPRLFGAVGYIVGGFLADLGRRKWVMLSALCISILSVPLPFILSEGYTLAGTCLYYIVVVAQIELLNVFFWELAPRTSKPWLIAGMSRILSCVCDMIHPLFSHISFINALMIEVLLAVSVVVCITLGNYIPHIHSKKERDDDANREKKQETSDANALELFAARHGLTPREKELLVPLIESDDEIQSIASDMNISTRTVYRHINSIYEKTGTETRYALMRYYYETK